MDIPNSILLEERENPFGGFLFMGKCLITKKPTTIPKEENMAPNTSTDYVLEIIEQVVAHTKQAMENGWCFCRSSEEHEWIKDHTTQINCKVVERLNSVLRGEEQYYEKDVDNITRFHYIWMDNNIQDKNWFL